MRNVSKFGFKVSIISLAVAGLFSASHAFADDEEIKALTQPKSSVQVEAISVDNSSAKFGEYNGLNRGGGYVNGAVNIRGGSAYTNNEQGDTTRWSITGENLGLTSRSANASIADQGSWNFGVNFDQLQHNITDSYQTPYGGAMGGNRFSLPTGMQNTSTIPNPITTQTSSALQGMNISSTRYNTTVTGGAIVDKNLNFTFEYNNLTQTGAKLQGVSGASLASGANTGNAQTISILPMPTNYQTDTVNLAANWKDENSHLTASYFGSFFKDGYNSMSFQSWNKTSGQTTTPYETMSTMPSNVFNQLNLAGGYDFSKKTKLTSNLSIAQNTQNQGFGGTYDSGMAAGVSNLVNATPAAPLTSPLPAGSMNGLVNTTHADLKITDQTIKDLTVLASAKFDQRDNLTQSNMYTSASVSSSSLGTIPNTPMSIKQTQLALGGDYRITKDQKVNLTIANNVINRWCNQYGTTQTGSASNVSYYPNYYNSANCVAATGSNENKADLLYRIKVAEGLDFKLGGGYSNRKTDWNSSVYVAMPQTASLNTNGANYPGYYPFFEASRKQYLGKASANWQATEGLMVTLGGKYTSDTYPDSTYGVQNGNSWSANLDGTYAYAEQGSVVAYATQQSQQRNMVNYVSSSGTGSWSNNLQTNTTTLGLGAKQGGLLSGKLTLSSDLTYSMAKSIYNTQQNYAFTTGLACNNSANMTCGLLPGIVNNMAIIKLGGSYELDKNSRVGLMYWFQHLYSNDYSYNSYQSGYTPSGVMPTNQTSPSYNVNVISANYTYTFD